MSALRRLGHLLLYTAAMPFLIVQHVLWEYKYVGWREATREAVVMAGYVFIDIWYHDFS